MPTPTIYEYKKSDHFPNGISKPKLRMEINDETGIGVQFLSVGEYTHEESGLVFITLSFQDDLEAQDPDQLPILEALFPVHDYTYVPPQEVTLVQRAPHFGGADSNLNGSYCKWRDGEWACVEWTLPKTMSLTSAILSVLNWQAGDVGFTTIANPGAMWSMAQPAATGSLQVDLGPASLVDVGTLQGGQPMGFTISDLYDPAHPMVGGSEVWVEFWRSEGTPPKRTKSPGLLERRKVASRSGSVLTLEEGIADTIMGNVILIPEYSTGFSPATSAKNPFLEGEELAEHQRLDARNLSGGMYFVGGTGDPIRLGSPDRSEATEPIPAGLCICVRVYGAAKTAELPEDQEERTLALNFEMRSPE